MLWGEAESQAQNGCPDFCLGRKSLLFPYPRLQKLPGANPGFGSGPGAQKSSPSGSPATLGQALEDQG